MTSTSVDRVSGARSSLAIKAPVKSASIANLALTGEQTVDGVALVTGDRVLVKAQTSGVNNGIYIVDTGTWSRAPDADGNADWTKGTIVFVTDASTTGGFWEQTTSGTIVIGTSSLAFSPASLGTVSAFMTTVLAAADATTAFALLAAAGLSFTGDISPAILGANTDNWAPAGFATASTVRISSSLAINLTGIAAGTDGRYICLHNVGSFPITLKNAATSVAANQFQLSSDYVLNANASVALEYDSTSTKWRIFGQQGTQASVSFNRLLNNVGLSVTMAAGAATIALKDATGVDPSPSSPCTMNIRSGTLATGAVSQLSVSAALSTVISSGSTGGSASALVSRIYVAAINAGGTVELAWINSMTAPDENTLITTTAEGGIGAADSAGTWYSTTARANVAFTLLGYFDSTQATAGTWATVPSTIAINPPTDRGWVTLIRPTTVTAAATADITNFITSAYDVYRLDIYAGACATDGSNFELRASEDAGATFKAGANDYGYAFNITSDGAVNTPVGSANASALFLTGSVGNTATTLNGWIEIYKPAGTTTNKYFNWQFSYLNTSGAAFHTVTGSGRFKLDTNAINALRLLFSAGNITSLTYALSARRIS